MQHANRTPHPVLLSLLSLALLAGCDKKPEEKKDDKKVEAKADDKKTEDKAVEAPPEPEPEPPAGPVFTGKNIMGDEVKLPLVAFDLSAAELPGVTIMVPEGTTAQPKSPSGYTLSNTQVNFSITVNEGTFNKEESVKMFGILDPEGKVVDESDTHVIYERSGTGGHLFQAGTTVGDKSYTCGTVASVSAFTRENIDQSVAACRSLAAAAAGDGAAPAPAGDAPAGDAPAPQ